MQGQKLSVKLITNCADKWLIVKALVTIQPFYLWIHKSGTIHKKIVIILHKQR